MINNIFLFYKKIENYIYLNYYMYNNKNKNNTKSLYK